MNTFIHTPQFSSKSGPVTARQIEQKTTQVNTGLGASSSLLSLFSLSLLPLRSALPAAMALGSGETGVPLYSPISDSLYPLLAVLLLLIGLVLTASFFIYEVTSTKLSRSLVREFATGGGASLFLGFGTLYLLLWTGVYV